MRIADLLRRIRYKRAEQSGFNCAARLISLRGFAYTIHSFEHD